MSTDDPRLDELARRLGHGFAERALLAEALTHVSAAGGGRASYERLEFLGDRVLGLVVADMLLDRFPDEAEGHIARRFAALVDKPTLAEVAGETGLGGFVRLDAADQAAGVAAQPAVLADVCEAVIGALYRDGGLEAARRFIEAAWAPRLGLHAPPPRDAKTALQEWAQARGKPLPEYRTVAAEGPPHEPVFTVEVTVAGLAPARGTGGSKRTAQREAAQRLLDAIDA